MSKDASAPTTPRSPRSAAGECVVVYPEGTITRDPDLWPMAGKSGAARIALATGCPVIPIGQWGAQDLLAPYAKKPDLFPRKPVTMKVGDPVDLSDLVGPAAHGRGDGGDRPDHGRDHRARRGGPRRDRAGGAVRPAHRRRLPDRQPPTRKGPDSRHRRARSHGQGRSLRRRVVGDRVLHRARRRRQRRHDVGAPRGGRRGDQRAPRERRLPPGIELPPAVSATHDVEKAAHDADIVIFATPSQTFRGNLEEWAPFLARRGDGVADEGRRARHPQADERGHRRGHRTPVPSGSR